jgi:hypothetical protein
MKYCFIHQSSSRERRASLLWLRALMNKAILHVALGSKQVTLNVQYKIAVAI